jgi:hypothetical protein
VAKPVVFITGGNVQAGNGTYLSRQVDAELLTLCQKGVFAYVLTSRQMGKSSLMVETARALAETGVRSVIIDLNQIGVQVTAEEWYLGLLVHIGDVLELETDAPQWWQSRTHLGFTQRLTQFFQEVLLVEVAEQIVIFVDEIDTTLSLNFTDDFFAAIRHFYHSRAQHTEFLRLSFVLIGVATPSDLIRDPQRTPFNIGQRVDLTDFTIEEALPLAQGFNLPAAEAEQVLRWVLGWTGGHPYLTQRLCQALTEQTPPQWSEADVDQVVNRIFLGATSERDTNLLFVRDMLTKRSPDPWGVLTTYHEVLRDRRPVFDEEQSLVKSHLKLAGIVKRQDGGVFKVRNRIYQTAFDQRWVKAHLPVNWKKQLRRIAVGLAVTAGLLLTSVPLAVWAEKQRRIAEESAREATRQSQIAEEQRLIAEKSAHNEMWQRELAEGNAREATRQQQLAEENAEEANRQRDIAEENAEEANHQRDIAEENAEEANRQRDIADKQRDFALESSLRMVELQLQIEPIQGLVWAILMTKRSTEVYGLVPNEIGDGLIDAVATAREANVLRPENRERLPPENSDIRALAVSQDRELIAGGDGNGMIYLWNRQGRLKGTFDAREISGHQSGIMDIAFSPDGRLMATAGMDEESFNGKGSIVLWNVQQRSRIGEPLLAHDSTVFTVAFSPDGQHLVSGGNASDLYLWSLQDISQPIPLDGHQGTVWGVDFSPDGQTIVSGSWDGTIRLWNLQGQRIGQWHSQGRSKWDTSPRAAGVSAIAFTPDGQTIVGGLFDGTIRLWNLQGVPVGQPFMGDLSISDIDISPDGQTIVSSNESNEDATLTVWDLQGNRIGEPLRGHSAFVDEVTFLDNQTIVSGSDDGTVRLWDIRDFPRNGTWQDALRVGCNRLQQHPVLVNPQNEEATAVRDICQRDL